MKAKSIVRAILIVILVSVLFTSTVVAAPGSDPTECERVIAHAQQQIGTVFDIIARLNEVGAPQDVLDLFQTR